MKSMLKIAALCLGISAFSFTCSNNKIDNKINDFIVSYTAINNENGQAKLKVSLDEDMEFRIINTTQDELGYYLLNVGETYNFEISNTNQYMVYKGMDYIAEDITIEGNTITALKEDITTTITPKFRLDWGALIKGQFFNTQNIAQWVLNIFNIGTIITMATYFIRDKKIAKKVGDTTKDTLNNITPNVVSNVFDNVITPAITKLTEQIAQIQITNSTLAKCIALMQEDTPEAKLAIINALQSITVNDSELLLAIKKEIEALTADAKKQIDESIARLEEIKKQNEEIANNTEKVLPEKTKEEQPIKVE